MLPGWQATAWRQAGSRVAPKGWGCQVSTHLLVPAVELRTARRYSAVLLQPDSNQTWRWCSGNFGILCPSESNAVWLKPCCSTRTAA